MPEASALLDIRILRLLRIFRIFKLTLYIAEYVRLGQALKASGRKILIFLSAVVMAVLIFGTLMSGAAAFAVSAKPRPTASQSQR